MRPVLPPTRHAQPGWSVVRCATSTGALTLTVLVMASCVVAPRPVYRPNARPPVEQTGAARVEPTPAREPDDVAYLRTRRLMIPVVGIEAERLRDDFHAARGGGRRHNAIDILAPYGTPVVAADDGYILRLSRNRAGGIVVYATDPEERVVYYYAHLAGYHDGLTAGKPIAKGDTLGYVGTSGNAPENTPHLHFQIMRMRSGGRYWNGEPLNPYPLLRYAGRSKRDEPVVHVAAPQGTPDPRPIDPEPPVPPRSRR